MSEAVLVYQLAALPLVPIAFWAAVDSKSFWRSMWAKPTVCYIFIQFIGGCVLGSWWLVLILKNILGIP